jgi:prepilin-type N-terminal cleavage/methylation domain-containing protein
VIQKPQHRRTTSDEGFTLIELLVVIVILGILAAVVVFAVSGVGDKGKSSAMAIDARTIRTAQEANCAQKGTYASARDLIANGLLSAAPTLHKVKLFNGGTCGTGASSGYAVYCDIADEGCGAGGAVLNGGPDGTLAPSKSSMAVPGRQESRSTVRLLDGRVFFLGQDGIIGSSPDTTQIYDPAREEWSVKASSGRAGIADALLLEGTSAQCGSRCGWVLVRFANPFAWMLYDPVGDQWFPAGTGPNPVTVKRSLGPAVALISPTGGQCGTSCGKVIAIGGQNNVDPQTSAQNDAARQSAELYDPVTNSWQLAPGSLQAPGRRFSVAATVPDGRVLVVGGSVPGSETTAEIYDPAGGTWAPVSSPDPPNSYSTDVWSADAVALGNGKILVAGTADGASANLFDPSSNSW